MAESKILQEIAQHTSYVERLLILDNLDANDPERLLMLDNQEMSTRQYRQLVEDALNKNNALRSEFNSQYAHLRNEANPHLLNEANPKLPINRYEEALNTNDISLQEKLAELPLPSNIPRYGM